MTYALLGIAGLVVAVIIYRRSRPATMRDSQYEVVDEAFMADARKALASSERLRWDRLLERMRKARGGVYRKGHLNWMLGVLQGVHPDKEIPLFDPPANRPYSPLEDPGIGSLRAYVQASLDGRELTDAVVAVRQRAAEGSLVAMAQLGAALVSGIAGFGPTDPEAGRRLLEKAVELGGDGTAHATLGQYYLDGTLTEPTPGRGLQLLETAYALAEDRASHASCLAEIYYDGLHGVAKDPAKAITWALRAGPRWRQLAGAVGLPQTRWIAGVINARRLARKETNGMTRNEALFRMRQQREHMRSSA